MTNNFLLEIGLEEIPAHVVTASIDQLETRVKKYLKDQQISFSSIKKFSTPRRLALLISDLSEKQPDIDEMVKGPAKKIAMDADGNWTKAAIGFTKGQGVSTDDITFKDIKGTEYVYVEKHIKGQPVQEILANLNDIIVSMNFPTMMKWGENTLQFVRPIKWLVAMLNNQVIPFSILDVTTDNISRGHRFLGKDVQFNDAKEYEEKLTEQFVIADAEKRKNLIRKQINEIVSDNNWKVSIDSDLLEEVNNLVEWPTAFYGNFDDKYLKIPEEVLVTSMKDHQRFFYVTDQNNTLLPHFISVRNGNSEYLENVIAGNEKVLTARLEDAMFFYQEDQKSSINDYVERLKKVSFHDKISTMYEKMMRVKVISDVLGQQLKLTSSQLQNLNRAAEIYKFDLVSGMVGEFSELQGIMGEKYALLQKEDPEVAAAIREHYMPISATGELPDTLVGSILAVADKLDSILTFFAAGMVPSGSNDPYALRRQAIGIVRIIADQKWDIDLNKLLNKVVDVEGNEKVAPEIDQKSQIQDVVLFVNDRIKQYLNDKKVRYDISDAVIASNSSDVYYVIQSGLTLNEHKDDADFKEIIESLTRVLRLADKAKDINLPSIDAKLFENDTEKLLFNDVNDIMDGFDQSTPEVAYQRLASLKNDINNYFDETMIMSDNESLKNNRLAQLTALANLIYKLGDLNQLVVK